MAFRHPFSPAAEFAADALARQPDRQSHRALYSALLTQHLRSADRHAARDYLEAQLAEASALPCTLPGDATTLEAWMRMRYQEVGQRYTDYLRQRHEGAPRRFFRSRAHALHFLRGVAPTKMVDGAWLHGLVHRWHDARVHGLIRTYLEELGEGRPLANHVRLYQGLLAEHGCEHWQQQPDLRYRQGAIQLALGWNAADFLPEIIGFNLGYEQLPLHLPITVYELEELGFDPHYFRLHVTVDNPSSGHARKALEAVSRAWPALGDGRSFYQRVRAGYRLNALGDGSEDVIADFELEPELLRILRQKGEFGRYAHSDHCRIGGRSINDWLSQPDDTVAFLQALKDGGWIEHHPDPRQSRFWRLIDGEQAMMAGVFSPYELQVIRDWITQNQGSIASPRVASRLRRRQRRRARDDMAMPALRGSPGNHSSSDEELRLLQQRLTECASRESAMTLLASLIGPATHPTPVGLMATRIYGRMLDTGAHMPCSQPTELAAG